MFRLPFASARHEFVVAETRPAFADSAEDQVSLGRTRRAFGPRRASNPLFDQTPHQAQFHAAAHWTVFKLDVHLLHMFFGGLQQFMEMAGDLANQMAFEDLLFPRVQ